MTTKFTEGPWERSDAQPRDYEEAIADSTRRMIAAVYTEDPVDLTAEEEANMRLIKRAPELLEALDNILRITLDEDLKEGYELSEEQKTWRAKALKLFEEIDGYE